ncbi:MAG: catalase [Eubacteriales bacterium]|nr:catalase [Eubacteriales bacterium]
MTDTNNGANKKQEQLAAFRISHDTHKLTTDQGITVSDTDHSLKAGPRGPALLEDFHLREKIMHFDHERIPERVVHARGFGAHGYFQVYEPMAEYTKAGFLQDPQQKTPVFTRFSTVVGSRGSADTVRDVRGFAVKFYTDEGNYDLVGNNMPVFFIQDAIKFPDMVHAIKPEPHNEIPQATAAHDTFWDFMVNTPELAHMVLWLMSDRGIPRSFRMMEGFGVNAYRFINAAGRARFVKFHWKPLLGVHSLVWDEAQKLSGKNPDYHRQDLWDAINTGSYPEWELGVQLIEEADEFKFDFDILDATKLWPEEIIPVKRVGKMTLNRNVDNFFAETEQAAFCPANIVPGIDFSNDPLLQGRLFSYLDTQLIRLGGPNFHQIPINRPVAPVHNNHRDGYHRMTIDEGISTYSKNTLQNDHPLPDAEAGYTHYAEPVGGTKTRQREERFGDHFGQAALFWNSMSETERGHIVGAFRFEVGSVKDAAIKQRVVDLYNNVTSDLAAQIAAGIGAAPPAQSNTSPVTASSPALSQNDTAKSVRTRKVAILAENGFNDAELTQVMDALTSAGACPEIVSSKLGIITGAGGKQMNAGKTFLTGPSVVYDAVYIPGGVKNVSALAGQGDAVHYINEAYKHCKTIGATGEAVEFLGGCCLSGVSVASDKNTVNPVCDFGVITVINASQTDIFCNEFISAVAQHRHWGREKHICTVPA